VPSKRKTKRIPRSFSPGSLAKINRHTLPGRIAHETMTALADSLGPGLSVQRAMLVERAVWLHLRCREIEALYATGEGTIVPNEYASLVNALSAVVARLGLNRIAKDSMTLQSFLEKRYAAAPAGAALESTPEALAAADEDTP
jgi:hypothetical protein